MATQPATGNSSPSCASLPSLAKITSGLVGDDFGGMQSRDRT